MNQKIFGLITTDKARSRLLRYGWYFGIKNLHNAAIRPENKYTVTKLDMIWKGYTTGSYTALPHSQVTEKIGQLKLFLNELRLLKLFGATNQRVIYAGAAPGSHIVTLCELFPDLTWELYDPTAFDARLANYPQVTLHNVLFTDTLAAYYASLDNNIFISDIRSISDTMTEDEKEKAVVDDMLSQMVWTSIIEAEVTQLKFRLPYPQSVIAQDYYLKFPYLDGFLYYQAYNGPKSTEMRLDIYKSQLYTEKVWDLVRFDGSMFRYNMTRRPQIHYTKFSSYATNYTACKCHDCVFAFHVLKLLKDKTKYKKALEYFLWRRRYNLINTHSVPEAYLKDFLKVKND